MAEVLNSACVYGSKRNWPPEAALAGKVSNILLHLPTTLVYRIGNTAEMANLSAFKINPFRLFPFKISY